MAVTSELAGFAARIDYANLPVEVAARVRLLVLDLLGNIVRARHDAESTPSLLAAARTLGLAAGNNVVFGDTARYTPAGAALLNAALGHSLDFDDTHAAGSLHPGCPVIPAAIAAGEMAGASGADVLAAIVAGYEVICRIALALPAGDHYARGFHPTATCGAFGAAAAAARAFGLPAAGIESALGIALSQASGSLQFLANGAWTKRFQVGWASMAGLTAAILAREGFKGAAAPLEGKHGFLNAYAPSPDPARAVVALGSAWELMRTAIKPYPSCRYGHAGIDAAIAFHRETGINPARIEHVTYGTSAAGMTLIGDPLTQRQNPQNVVDGQFSGPFVIASGLIYGEMGWDSYGKLQAEPIRALLPRIVCERDADAQAAFPDNMAGKLTVVAEGQRWERFVAVPRGEPDNFMTDAEVRAKFAGLAGPVLGDDRADRLANAVLSLDRSPNLGPLTRLAAATVGARLAGD